MGLINWTSNLFKNPLLQTFAKKNPSKFKSKELLKTFEGLELKAYQDIVGVWTIGYGSTRGLNGDKVMAGDTITLQEADKLLELDLEPFCKGVSELVEVKLSQNQFDALVSLSYNIGIGNFKKSTLLKKLNKYDYVGASEEFPKWRRAGNKIIYGLVKRREQERLLFLR